MPLELSSAYSFAPSVALPVRSVLQNTLLVCSSLVLSLGIDILSFCNSGCFQLSPKYRIFSIWKFDSFHLSLPFSRQPLIHYLSVVKFSTDTNVNLSIFLKPLLFPLLCVLCYALALSRVLRSMTSLQ